MFGVGRVSCLCQDERCGCAKAVLGLCYRQCEQDQWPGHGTRANVHMDKGNGQLQQNVNLVVATKQGNRGFTPIRTRKCRARGKGNMIREVHALKF